MKGLSRLFHENLEMFKKKNESLKVLIHGDNLSIIINVLNVYIWGVIKIK